MVDLIDIENNTESQLSPEKIKSIMDSFKPKKKTFGQQVIDKFENGDLDEKQTARETTNEMGKSWNKELEDVITKHTFYKEPYYIQVILKHEPYFENAVKATFCVRRTRPTPNWNETLYKMDNKTGALTLEWTLPDELNATQVTLRPDLFDENLVTWCKYHFKGQLK